MKKNFVPNFEQYINELKEYTDDEYNRIINGRGDTSLIDDNEIETRPLDHIESLMAEIEAAKNLKGFYKNYDFDYDYDNHYEFFSTYFDDEYFNEFNLYLLTRLTSYNIAYKELEYLNKKFKELINEAYKYDSYKELYNDTLPLIFNLDGIKIKNIISSVNIKDINYIYNELVYILLVLEKVSDKLEEVIGADLFNPIELEKTPDYTEELEYKDKYVELITDYYHILYSKIREFKDKYLQEAQAFIKKEIKPKRNKKK